ncbi:MAG: tRNA (adenosine(37)-N6)-dimethylallyltransferase MiaA [Pseudomonadota bacterium]
MTGEKTGPRVLLTGPTASGKSALALALAQGLEAREERPALILNADALQVYSGWRLLTARPDAEACAAVEHGLDGYVPPEALDYSVGRWLRDAVAALHRAGPRPVVIVGGSGLYLKALTQGLAPIPEASEAIVAAWEAARETRGLPSLLAELEERDPATAARIDGRNPRRVLRALIVLEATGQGLAAWAKTTPPPGLPLGDALAVRLVVDRGALRARIRRRLQRMAAEGVLGEVTSMRARGLSWHAPAMQALGARAFAAHLDGEGSLQDAIERAAIDTGRYAKRQDTWARNQFGRWRALEVSFDDADPARLAARILTPGA